MTRSAPPAVLCTGLAVLILVAGGCDRGASGEAPVPDAATPATGGSVTAGDSPAPTDPAPPAPAAAAPAGTTLEVPSAPAPVVDGTVEPEEWEDAAVGRMTDGTGLRWLHAGGSLYLAVGRDAVGSVNLVVADGARVRVLHSSAALGSAEYRRSGETTWQLVRDFEWCCRSGADAAGGRRLLAEEGWLASTGFDGEPGEVEYLLEMGDDELRVAVSVVDADGATAVWPEDLPPEARSALSGARRDPETFHPEAWARVAVGR